MMVLKLCFEQYVCSKGSLSSDVPTPKLSYMKPSRPSLKPRSMSLHFDQDEVK